MTGGGNASRWLLETMMKNILMMSAFLFAFGCATSDDATTAAASSEPEVTLAQLSRVAEGTQYDSGPVSVHYGVEVRNPTETPMHLDRVSVQSIGGGAYDLRPYSQAFDVMIEAKATRTIDFWAPAYVANPTVSGANGPVTIRATLELDSAGKKFQKIVMQNIASLTGN